MHVLALPYAFFQQRAVGDLVLRLDSGKLISEVYEMPQAIETIKGMGGEQRAPDRYSNLFVDLPNDQVGIRPARDLVPVAHQLCCVSVRRW